MGRINLKLGIAILVAAGSVAFIAEMSEYNSRADRGYSEADEANIIYAVSQRLKDPDSAAVSRLLIIPQGGGEIEACGLINGKNSFGSYTGDRAFHASYNIDTHILHDVTISEDSTYSRIVKNRCQKMLE